MGLFKSASNAGRSRPGPKPRSNIRGNISGPIPIPDDEFPMRNPGSSIVEEEPPKQLEPETQRDSAAASTSSPFNGTREDKTNSLAQSGPSQASTGSTHVRRRTNRSSTVRYSTLSEVTDSASPSRKKSSFRIALSRLFKKRSRKQDSRSASESEAHSSSPVDHHRSDPVVGERSPTDSETEPKRSASLPVTELNKALRSHSIGPDDYMAIHSARNSLQSDSVFLRRRAVTTSGRPTISKLRDQSAEILGLSPRPASAQGHDMADDYDPESIGRAVSVDYITSRRRSRSLSQLPDVSEGHGLVRKRSEEIRYWRASQNPGGLLSSDLSVSNREEPVTTEPTEPITETHVESQPIDKPEPFNFGSINTIRITQAASLEDRVVTLEVQNQKLERLVSKLFQVVPGIDKYSAAGHPACVAPTAPPTTYATTGFPAVGTSIRQDVPVDADALSPSYSVSEQSNMSFFEDEKTFIGSIHPPTRGAPRPISNVTVRGATTLPTLPRDAPNAFTSEDYNTLKTLLEAERAARHALEIRVTQLAQMIHTMSRPTHKLHVNAWPGVDVPVSTFEDDDDDDDEDDEEPPSASIDDSDVFETPREEQLIHEFDDFGDDEVDESSRKRAARTLSLGQLTLGKPKHSQKPGVNL
ncbi:hypothetical protein F4801DRAFT_341881 [Xylaria longipes]|nr:hypothetical protein F4801DRAFT_341881 [Xylaria longipes]RYC53698.1 hypothetical protein CHU98_g12510 [Xylaria longipes]